MNNYLEIILRASVVYIFILIAIRLFGKKELTQLSISDLVLILLISNAVQNAMVGDNNSLAGGLMAAASLFVLNYFFKLLMYRFPGFSKVVEGAEVVLIYKGKIHEANLLRERITISELESVVRAHGVNSFENVEIAMLERNGNISVVSNELQGQTFHPRARNLLHPKHKKAD